MKCYARASNDPDPITTQSAASIIPVLRDQRRITPTGLDQRRERAPAGSYGEGATTRAARRSPSTAISSSVPSASCSCIDIGVRDAASDGASVRRAGNAPDRLTLAIYGLVLERVGVSRREESGP